MSSEPHKQTIPVAGVVIALAVGTLTPVIIALVGLFTIDLLPLGFPSTLFIGYVAGLPLIYFCTAWQLSYRWPNASGWLWAVTLLVPLLLIGLGGNGITIVGLLVLWCLLPVYLGNKLGWRRRRRKDGLSTAGAI
jgi:hypothetical protein